MKYFLILLTLLLIIFSGYTCEEETMDVDPRLRKIDSVIQAKNKIGKFNGVVLIAENGKILYTKAMGFASSSKKSLSIENRFLIGSIQKEIPAIAIMQLKEEGKLQLDERLSTYIPDLPRWADEISIKNLLQYSSGLPKINWESHKEINDEVLLEDLRNIEKLEFGPGEGYLYTNFSPFLLSKVIEKISGLPFPKYAHDHIFLRAELKNSLFEEQFPFKNSASMAMGLSEELIEEYPPFVIKEPLFLYATTIEDLHSLIENLHQGKLITRESLKMIAVPAPKGPENRQSALGRVSFLEDQISEHVHHGSSGNYESLMSRYNDKGVTIILMTNIKRRNLFDISSEIQGFL